MQRTMFFRPVKCLNRWVKQ